MRISLMVALLSLLVFSACHSNSPQSDHSNIPSHESWTQLLSKHVDEEGFVNYQGFIQDSTLLNYYLNDLVNNPPDKNQWTKEDQITYWINVYNAFTIKLVIDHYPLESIKDIGSKIQIPFINTPWDIKFIEIAGKKYDLNNVEHSILRKDFEEPRIHFAIVCASYSCPKLRREAYTGEKLEKQLEEQAFDFINDPRKNNINTNIAEISRIFSWFKSDFTKHGSLKDFLNQYSNTKLDENTKISFMDYDWRLNGVK